MSREVPRSRAAMIAWAVLLTCLVAWVASWAVPFMHDWDGIVYVRHGLEGAFVGGLCDAFAIWRVYVEIEQGYEPLSREVSRFVVRDMARADDMVGSIRATLDAPATSAALQRQIREKFPSRRQLAASALDFWDAKLRDRAVERAVTLDFQAWVDDPGELSRLADDPKLRLVMRHCLAAALSDEERAGRLHTLLDLNWFYGKAFNKKDLLTKLREVVISLDKPPTPGPTASGALLREYAKAYVAAWNKLDEEERRAAVRQLLEICAPVVVTKLAELAWDGREELLEFLATGAGLSRHPWVELLIEQLEPEIKKWPEAIEDVLRRKLSDLGGHGVRVLIERNTRERLDWIQFNGTMLGLLVGLVVGALSGAASYLLR